jgi:hypothetical protein
MIKLGTTTIYPAGSPPPSSLLIESFENIPFTGSLYSPWDNFVTSGTTSVTRTSSHVTQGSFSWRMTASATSNPAENAIRITGVNLTGYVSLLVDCFVQTATGSDYAEISLIVGDGVTDSFEVVTTTGTFVLTADLTVFSDKSNLSVLLFTGGDGSGSVSLDAYFDNLIAS